MAKRNQGFTLVELLVTISIGAIVTLAATTVLLMGFRINRQSVDTVTRQNTTRVLLTAMENLASDGSIKEIKSDPGKWSVKGEDDHELFSYDEETQTIYTGDAALLEGVLSSYITLDSNNVLNIYVETDDGGYNSAVYCRMLPKDSPEVEDQYDKVEDIVIKNDALSSDIPYAAQRKAFLKLLASQYKINVVNEGVLPNPGVILDREDSTSTGKYYSEWYIGEGWGENGWNENTPWCACFVSWAIFECRSDMEYADPDNIANNTIARNERPSYADVDSFVMRFKADGDWVNGKFWAEEGESTAVFPGDIIFFDWIINEERNPQHVGVVLTIAEEDSGTYVYTIEGNTSNMVGIRRYKIDDPRILGYGVLDWKTVEVTQ